VASAGHLPELARQGADVAFVDVGGQRSPRATVAEIQALGRKALYIPADVTDPEACVKAVAAVVETFGKVDILVNNAGITRDDLIMRMPIDDWKKVLEVNLFGAFYMIKAPSARCSRLTPAESSTCRASRARPARWARPTTRRPRPA